MDKLNAVLVSDPQLQADTCVEYRKYAGNALYTDELIAALMWRLNLATFSKQERAELNSVGMKQTTAILDIIHRC